MESPDSGTRTKTVESAVRAISSSDCPTPTVSMRSRSNPNASSTSATSRVAAASPPSDPRVAIDRMKTPGSSATFSIRTRSPSNAPPVNGDVGSTAMTPTDIPASRKLFTRSAVMVLLPAPGGPVRPMRRARPVLGCNPPRICSKPSRWFSTMLTTRASAAGLPALKSSSTRSDDTRQNPFLLSPHWRLRARCAVGVIVTEHMKGAMDDKSQQLLVRRNSLAFGVCARDLGADVDVAHDRPPTTLAAERERDHVGRAVMTEVAAVQLGDRGPADEGD